MLARWRRLWRDCRLAVLIRGGLGQGGGGRRSFRLARTMLRSDRVARCNLFSLIGPLSWTCEWRRFLFDENRGCKSSKSARIWSARSSLSEESSSSGMSPPRYGMTCNTHTWESDHLYPAEKYTGAGRWSSSCNFLSRNFRNCVKANGKTS